MDQLNMYWCYTENTLFIVSSFKSKIWLVSWQNEIEESVGCLLERKTKQIQSPKRILVSRLRKPKQACNMTILMLMLYLREGMPSWGTLTGLRSRPMETSWSSTKRSAGFCPCIRVIPDTDNLGREGIESSPGRRTWEWWLLKNLPWAGSECSQPRKPMES